MSRLIVGANRGPYDEGVHMKKQARFLSPAIENVGYMFTDNAICDSKAIDRRPRQVGHRTKLGELVLGTHNNRIAFRNIGEIGRFGKDLKNLSQR